MLTVDIDEKKFQKIISQINGINPQLRKVFDKTARNCKTSAPTEITKAVTAVYGIDRTRMVDEGKLAKRYAKTVIGQVKVHGAQLTVIRLTYKGRVLSPRSFKMKPNSLPETSKKRKKQKISAEIFKKQRKDLTGKRAYGTPVFLAPTPQGIVLPFQRKYEDKKYPIYAIRSVSIPQMIENEKVTEDINQRIDKLYTSKLEKNVENVLKKLTP